MGGDGGTISSNRTYLRGAGKACHTADHPSNAFKRSKAEDVERARSVLSTCAVSGAPLDLTPAADACGKGGGSPGGGSDIVACPHGNLYRREKALEALLQRRRPGRGDGREGLGPHVRGMRDLHPVRFHVAAAASSSEGAGTYAAACPIAGSDISSGNIPSFVIVRAARKSKDKEKKGDGGGGEDEAACGPNVLSERAIKEMGVGGLQEEYGPFEEGDLIRLAPPTTGGVFEGIRRRWEAVMKEEEIAKVSVTAGVFEHLQLWSPMSPLFGVCAAEKEKRQETQGPTSERRQTFRKIRQTDGTPRP